MKREDIEKLLGWAREAQKVFEESGETDFEELRRREQREIYDRFAGSGFDVHDGSIDKYTGYEKVEIGDLTTRFYFHDESNYRLTCFFLLARIACLCRNLYSTSKIF